jgi:hypothetical protein
VGGEKRCLRKRKGKRKKRKKNGKRKNGKNLGRHEHFSIFLCLKF